MMNECRAAHIRRINDDVLEIMKEYSIDSEMAIEYLKIAALEDIDNSVYDLQGMV